MNMTERGQGRRGFSLIEVMISMTILAIVLGAAMVLLGTSQKTYESAGVRQQLEERARVVTDEMVTLLRRCSSGAAPNPAPTVSTGATGDQAIQFTTAVGFDNASGNPAWGASYPDTVAANRGHEVVSANATITFDSALMAGEAQDTFDNNRNGVNNERAITYTVRNGVNVLFTKTMTEWLRPGSLSFAINGGAGGVAQNIRIRFVLERLDPATKSIPDTTTAYPVVMATFPTYKTISVPVDITVQVRN